VSDIPTNPGPVNPEPIVNLSGEGIAERYVAQELVESRASLKRTQIIGVVMTVLVVGSMAFLTSGWRSNLEPNAAAEIATGLASQRVDDLTPQFADYVRTEVPKAIRSAPDELIKRLPEYRENLEQRVETDLRARSADATKRLHDELFTYLSAHKEAVGELLKNANDPAKADEIGKGLEDEFRKFLKEEKVGDDTIQAKLDNTLKALSQVEQRTAHLAANQGLTPSEQKARHAVAMLMKRIDFAKDASGPIKLPTIDPEKARTMINDAVDQTKAKLNEAADHASTAMPATGGTIAPKTMGAVGAAPKVATPSAKP